MRNPFRYPHRFRNLAFAVLVAVLAAVPLTWAGIKDSDVDSTAPAFTKKTIPIFIQGQLGTSDVTAIVKFVAIEDWKVLNIKAVCRARTGAANDVKFDVLDDAVSMLSAQIPCDTGGTIASGTLTATPLTVASGSTITVSYNATNTPTADDCTIEIVYRSKVATE